jgi:allantoinase
MSEIDMPGVNRADLAIHGGILSHGVETQGTVAVRDGRIVMVSADPNMVVDADEDIRLDGGEVLIPGIVDTHVHINEPGRTEWEGFACATSAAAAGGVTTVLDMPLNSNPPTLTVEALEAKRLCALNKAHVQLGFWGGVDESNLGRLKELWDAGVFGFKCFLSPSGVDEYGSLPYSKLEQAMREIASFGGQLICHAEDPHELAEHAGKVGATYRSFAQSRPAECEANAVRNVARLVERTGCRTHILHVSSGLTVDALRDAKAKGLPITAETCPHYLTLDCDHIPDNATAFKCCPPIRDLREQDALWRGLVDGTLDFIATDHSPADASMKSGTLATAWGGVSSLQVGFRAVLTEAMKRGLGIADAIRWMSCNTAKFAGFHDRGEIAPGKRADLVIIRPGERFTVDAAALKSRNPISAFDGMALNGVITRTFISGKGTEARESNLIARP